MRNELTTSLLDWFHQLDITVSRSYLEKELLSHPYYPSLASVTDTLDKLGLNNTACVVDKDNLTGLPLPFLAHTEENGGGFIVVGKEMPAQQKNDFIQKWSGIVLFVEKPENWKQEENELLIGSERKTRIRWIYGISLLIMAALFSLTWPVSPVAIAFMVASIAGLTIAVLIVHKDLGIDNKLADKLCAAVAETDCGTVIRSKSGLEWLNWSDAGIIYFSSVILLQMTTASLFLPFITLTTVPFIFFSVYYQWRVLNKWCMLCLMVVCVLSIQFILLLPSLNFNHLNLVSGTTVSQLIFIASMMIVSWSLLIKPLIVKTRKLSEISLSLQRFRNRPVLFSALLQEQKKVEVSPVPGDFQLGNPEADLQVMVACNPYCNPCAKAHKILHDLVEKQDIGLTIRFAINANDKESRKTKAAAYLYQLMTQADITGKRKILKDWYEMMEISEFEKKYPVRFSDDSTDWLHNNDEWSRRSVIAFTPTIFVNGYEMPKEYGIEQLPFFLSAQMQESNHLVK